MGQPDHITLHTATHELRTDGKHRFTVHVFSNRNDPSKGYDHFFIHGKRTTKINKRFGEKIADALENRYKL